MVSVFLVNRCSRGANAAEIVSDPGTCTRTTRDSCILYSHKGPTQKISRLFLQSICVYCSYSVYFVFWVWHRIFVGRFTFVDCEFLRYRGNKFSQISISSSKGYSFEPFCSEIGFTDLDLDRDFRKSRDLCINFHLLRSAVDIGNLKPFSILRK